jgi:hypothetical protein
VAKQVLSTQYPPGHSESCSQAFGLQAPFVQVRYEGHWSHENAWHFPSGWHVSQSLQSTFDVHGGRQERPPSAACAPEPVPQRVPPVHWLSPEHDGASTQMLAALIGP